MYTYNEEEEMFFFTGDLKEYLLNHGVESEHISKMQCKTLELDRDTYYDFPEIGSCQRDYIALVPLENVIGTSRGTVGLSVYENVRTMCRGEREPHRFADCFSYFEKLPLNQLRKSYEDLYEPVIMVHYVDDDRYFVTNNGNHRTLIAMLVGAKYIRAKVTDAQCNELKKKKYTYSKAFMHKYHIVSIMRSINTYDISYVDEIGTYEVCGYQGPTEDEDLFALLERLSNTIERDARKACRLSKMPTFLQKIALHYEKNMRIKQLVFKKYSTDEELKYWGYRIPVVLHCL